MDNIGRSPDLSFNAEIAVKRLVRGVAKSLHALQQTGSFNPKAEQVHWIHQLKQRIASQIKEDQPLRGALPTGCWDGHELRKQPASAGFFVGYSGVF